MKYIKTYETKLRKDFDYTGIDLIMSIENNEIENALYFIELGVDINYVDSNGITPLMMCVMFNKYEIFKKLIDNDADWYIKDNEDEDFIDYLNYYNSDYKEKYYNLLKSHKDKYNEYLIKKQSEKFNI